MSNFLKIKEIIKVLLPDLKLDYVKKTFLTCFCMVENFINREEHVIMIKRMLDYIR